MASEAIGVGLIGLGTVGGGVVRLLREQAALHQARLGKRIEIRKVLVRDVAKARATGLLPADLITSSFEQFHSTPDMPIVIEVAGGVAPVGDYVRASLEAGKHIITANKSLLAAKGPELFALARRKGVSIAFEASSGGGIPIVTALQFGLMANRIDAIYGILNGTCNYILTEMAQQKKSYAAALAEAQQKGFAEADPTLDISGQDAAQKLIVLASIAFGVRIDPLQVRCEGIGQLALADMEFGRELGYALKLLAIAERDGSGGSQLSLRVQPCFVHQSTMLAQVHGSFNAVSVFGSATGHVMAYGRGAGDMPTASAVVGDLLNVASGWYPKAFESMRLWCDGFEPVRVIAPEQLHSRFYVRVNAKDQPGVMARVTQALGDAGISLSAVIQHEENVGNFVPLAITTHRAREGALMQALERIAKLEVIDGQPVCIRILEMPRG